MRTARLALAAAIAAGALAGCTSWNPLVNFGIISEPAHKPTELAPITETLKPRAVWSTNVGKSTPFNFKPDAEGGRIYAAAADGTITALEDESGRVASRIETKKPISGGVEVGASKIVVGTTKGEVIAFDPTSGKQLWSSQLAGEVIATPAISRKVAVVRTSDGRIFGLSVDDGKRLWVFQRPAPSLLLRSETGVLAVGGDVLAGYANGKLIALDLEDGKLTWEVTVSLPRGATELERIADISGLPVIDGSNVCAGAFQGKVACFEIQTRNMLWARDVSTAQALANDSKYLYVTDDTSAVQALDKTTGASVWKQDKLLWRKLTGPVVVQGSIVVGDGFGYLHILSPSDGAIIGRLATDGSAINAILPANGGVVVQTAKGTVSLVRF
jgi:outer membrane protein assembly factor BamB